MSSSSDVEYIFENEDVRVKVARNPDNSFELTLYDKLNGDQSIWDNFNYYEFKAIYDYMGMCLNKMNR